MKKLKYLYLFFISLSLLVGCSDESTGPQKTSTFEVQVTANPPDGGSVSPQSKTVQQGNDLNITANAAEDHVFTGWSSNGNFSGDQSSCTVTVISDISIVANFAQTEYNLTTKTEGKGEISEAIVKAKKKEYKRNTKVKLTAKPDVGWQFSKWKGPVEQKENNTGQVTLDKDITVTAVFSQLDVLGLVSSTDQLSKLTQALQYAELIETLQGDGPFTVFTPNNDAFNNYLSENNFGSIQEIPPKVLKKVLQYHVIKGKKLLSGDLKDGSQKIETVQGNMLTVKKSGGKVTLTDESGSTYKVIAADNLASNGIVHIIDGVLSPKSQGTNQLPIFDKTNWTIHDFSSQDTDHGQFAENVIDGDDGTLWQGNFGDNKQQLPHSVSVNMGQSYQIYGLKINPKHANAKSLPTKIKVEFSTDGNTWGNSKIYNNPFTYSENDFEVPRLDLPEPVKAQYFRVTILEDAGDVPVTGLNEVDVYGKLDSSTNNSLGFKLKIYGDELNSSFKDGTYGATINFDNTEHVFEGSHSVKLHYQGSYKGFIAKSDTPVSLAGIDTLEVSIYAGPNYGPVKVYFANQIPPYKEGYGNQVQLNIEKGKYKTFYVPLSEMGNPDSFKQFFIQNGKDKTDFTIYIDNLGFY